MPITPPRLPARPPRRMTSFPLFPLLAALLLVVLALQGARMLFELNKVTPATTPKLASASSVFANVERVHPKSATSITNLRLVRAVVPPLASNIRIGSPVAGHVLTIFTDPLCTSCRVKVLQTLHGLDTSNLQIVYKYWPEDPAHVDGGLILQVARQEGKGAALLQELHDKESTLTELDMLHMLDVLGVDLSKQRHILEDNSVELTGDIGRDMAQAKELNLGAPPQFVLDDYLIDGRILYPQRLNLYLKRLDAKQHLIQAGDYWLGGKE